MPIDKAKLIGFFKTLSKIDEDILQLENEIKLIFIEAKKTRLELERRFDQLLIDGNEDLSRYSRAQSRLNIRKEMIKEREKIEIERLENEYRLKINQTRRGGLLLIDEFTKKENIIKQKYEKIYKQIDDWKDDFASKAKKIKDNDQFQKDNVKMQLDRLFIDAETKAQDKSYEIAKLKVQRRRHIQKIVLISGLTIATVLSSYYAYRKLRKKKGNKVMEFKVIAEETKTRINREEFYRIYRSLFEDYYKIVEELKETQQKIEKIQKKYAPNLSQKYFELEELRKKQNAITRTSKDLVNKGSINNSDDVLSRQISTKREELKKLMVSMSKQVEPLENDLQRLSKAKKLKVATLSGKTGIGMLAAAALFYAYKSSKRVRESILHECHFDDIKKIREEVKEYIEQLKMDREEELMKTNELDNPDVRDDTRANIDRYYDDKINELVDKLRNTLDSIKIKTSK